MSETGRRWKRWRRAAISTVIVMAAVAAVVSVARMPARTEEVPPKETVRVNVEVIPVEAISRMPDILELPGSLEPNVIVDVPAELRGCIEEISCEEGQLVQKGDVLLRLDTALLKAEFDRAKAQAEFDRRTLERSSELLERGVLTKSGVEEAEARSIVSAANLEVARTNLERATVRAPLTGILDDLLREEGEYVAPGDTIAQVVDVERLKVIVHIPERDVPFLKLGSTIEISVDALDGMTLAGKVTYISEVADPMTHTTRIEITVDNRRGLLHSGMIVRARIPRRELRNIVMIPLSAVIPLEEGRLVYVLEDGRAEKREIETGITRGSRIQVVRGLAPGDRLIVSGHRLVTPGQAVNPTN